MIWAHENVHPIHDHHIVFDRGVISNTVFLNRRLALRTHNDERGFEEFDGCVFINCTFVDETNHIDTTFHFTKCTFVGITNITNLNDAIISHCVMDYVNSTASDLSIYKTAIRELEMDHGDSNWSRLIVQYSEIDKILATVRYYFAQGDSHIKSGAIKAGSCMVGECSINNATVVIDDKQVSI